MVGNFGHQGQHRLRTKNGYNLRERVVVDVGDNHFQRERRKRGVSKQREGKEGVHRPCFRGMISVVAQVLCEQTNR